MILTPLFPLSVVLRGSVPGRYSETLWTIPLVFGGIVLLVVALHLGACFLTLLGLGTPNNLV